MEAQPDSSDGSNASFCDIRRVAFPEKLELIEMSSAGYMLWATNESEIVGLLKSWCGPKT